MALSISALAMTGYAAEAAFPDSFSDKYTKAKEYEGNGQFWQGWFGTGLAQQAILISTGLSFTNEDAKRKLCLASALNWGICLWRSIVTKDDMDTEINNQNQLLLGALGLVSLAGGGAFEEFFRKDGSDGPSEVAKK